VHAIRRQQFLSASGTLKGSVDTKLAEGVHVTSDDFADEDTRARVECFGLVK